MSVRLGLLLALVFTVLAAVAVMRTDAFGSLEPRQDHGAFIQWVRGAAEADHLLPQRMSGAPFMAALQQDEESVANAVLRPLYLTNILLLKVLAFSVFLVGSWIAGAHVPGQIAISVAVNTAALGLFLAAALSFGRPRGAGRCWLLAGIGAALLGNGFLRSFAPLGDHNVGLLVLAVLTLAVMRLEVQARDGRGTQGAVCLVAVVLFLSTFSNHTNFLLSAPAVGLTVLALRRPWKWTMGAGLRLGLAFGLSLIPILVLCWVASRPGYLGAQEQGFLGYITFAREAGHHGEPLIQAISLRAGHWLSSLVTIMGWPGLLAAAAGLMGWAVIERVRFPLVLMVVHFILATGMSAFSHHLDRTGAYLLPILCLGLGWSAAALATAAMRAGALLRRAVAALVLVAVSASYAWAQWPVLADPRVTPLWEAYYVQQGGWAAIQREVTAQLPEGAALIPADYAMAHLWGAMRANGERTLVVGVLSALEVRAGNGTLGDYLAARRPLAGEGRRFFLLLPADALAAAEEAVRRMGAAVPALAPWRNARLLPVRQWHAERMQLSIQDLVLAELAPAQE